MKNIEEKNWGEKEINQLSKVRFFCLEQFFHGNFFTWKIISNWITFFEIEGLVFVKLGSKITYYFWKVSAWLGKLDSTNLEVFLDKRSFFVWINVCKTFSRPSADVFWTLKTDCQNCVFICPDKLLREKNFPGTGKMLNLMNVFQNGGRGRSFFGIWWKKWTFGGKLLGELTERDSTAPDGLSEERHVLAKIIPKNKLFQHSA